MRYHFQLTTCAFLVAQLAIGAGFPNPDFENGTTDGWVVSGRKDARGTVVSSSGLLKSLQDNRAFIAAGGWEGSPLGRAVRRDSNTRLLKMSSSGQITAETSSDVVIEAGTQYTVSVVVQNLNGGPQVYYFEVYALGADGVRVPLGTDQVQRRSGEIFLQSVTFTAEAGQPHVGNRIAVTARYTRTNLVDNLVIETQPIVREGIAEAVRSLPLIDVVDADGNSRFALRGYDDFRYRNPAEAGSLENTGAGFSALAQFTTRKNAAYTLYDLEKLTLRDGEAAALTVDLIDVRAYAGFAVDGSVFLLGRHGNRRTKRDDGSNINPFRTPDYMMYIARVSPELKNETIVIRRRGTTIDWYACGRKGSYVIDGLSVAPRLSLFARDGATLRQLRKGTLSKQASAFLDDYMSAPRHPHGRPNTPGFPERRQKDDNALAAALSVDVDKPLADAEIEAMLAYAAGYNAHGFDTHADPIFSLPTWYIPAKIFLITRRKEALDELIRIADSAIIIRNGFEVAGVKYGVRFGREYNRYLNLHDFCIFPAAGFESETDRDGAHFNERHEYVRSEISFSSDSHNARTITPSLAAYCISLHPEIWDEKTPDDPCKLGATYRQRGERYIKELALNYTDIKDIKLRRFQENFIWDSYADFRQDRALYEAELDAWHKARDAAGKNGREAFDTANPRPQPKEKRAGINRFVAGVSCTGFAASAAETFGDKASMAAIDACAEKLLNSWFNTYQFYAPGHDGEYLNEPDKWYRAWGYQPNCVNPKARDYETDTPRGQGDVRAEDRAHANFTMKGFHMLHESGRYPHIMTKQRMTDLARTFNEMVMPEYNQWRPMPRASKHKDVAPVTEFGGLRLAPLMMFAEYNAELKAKVVRAMQESTYYRGLVINRLILAGMRAARHGQIPNKLVRR